MRHEVGDEEIEEARHKIGDSRIGEVRREAREVGDEQIQEEGDGNWMLKRLL